VTGAHAADAAAGVRVNERSIVAPDGSARFLRSWLPATAPRAILAITHGFAEHGGRYAHVGEALARRGIAVHAIDLRGHGQSSGPRALVRSLDEYVDDADVMLSAAHDGATPRFILGHSMGGAVVALAAATRPPDVRGVLLSGAVLPLDGRRGIMSRVMRFVGRLFPRLPLAKLKATDVSRDLDIVRRYDSDPLVYRGRIKAGLAAAMIDATRRIYERTPAVSSPLLVMHGTADALASPDGSRVFHERAGSPDKTLRLYEGFFHEILNEPERDRVIADIAAWIDERLG
jgi:alpha-beta hydrolase superfamily lysophospholipase